MKKTKAQILLAALATLFVTAPANAADDAQRPTAPDFKGVQALARQLASRPFVERRVPVSQRLGELSYDQCRQIAFDDRKSVWRRERLPFQLQFFHPGGPHKDAIEVNTVDGDEVTPIPFSRDFFNYDASLRFTWMDFRGARFTGFRVLYPLNRADKLDEVIAWQGATYFRAVPASLVYGLSARALAVNCGSAGAEEFPRFKEYWIDRPDRDGKVLRLRGLFDSDSLAGAVECTIVPGAETVTRVRIAVFPRVDLPHVGIAPLTSMFWFSKNQLCRFDDPRPQVHDSDGLLAQTGAGEWLWRPLDNTGKLRQSLFIDKNPKGFGLLQRERDPACYQDLHAQYQRRPSAWVRPGGDWGAGAVRLLEIPTESEFSDNIVAFWEPAQILKAGSSAEYAYEVAWSGEKPDLPPIGRAVLTRTGAVPGEPRSRRFVIDFTAPGLEQQGPGFAPEALVTAARGRILNQGDEFNPYQRAWRVSFTVAADAGAEAVELRARLRKGGGICTETWTYCWTP